MPTSKKPRKKYRPKPMGANPIKAFRFNADAEFWLKTHPHAALEAMRSGTATATDFDTVSLRVRWGAQMVEDHLVDPRPAREVMQAGVSALESVGDRFDRLGKVGATGEEFRNLGEALNLTDDLQSTLTRRELEQSLRPVLDVRDADLREMQA